jgi:methionyl-tRNA formyltransferase
MKLAFITKKEVDFFIQDAINFVNKNFDSKVFYSDWNSSIDQNLYNDDIDIVVSYLSRWILPKEILNNTKFCAINFHPAPPNYRGYGPYSFALYNNESAYGVTCHHMNEKLDNGSIIDVSRFNIYKTDTVETLIQRSYSYQLQLFYKVFDLILTENKIPISNEKWSDNKYTKKELDKLMILNKSMSSEEIERRNRALAFKNWKPFYGD